MVGEFFADDWTAALQDQRNHCQMTGITQPDGSDLVVCKLIIRLYDLKAAGDFLGVKYLKQSTQRLAAHSRTIHTAKQ